MTTMSCESDTKTPATPRLGEVLVSRGVLTPAQVEEILEVQRERARPFGDLAERLFGVDPAVVESAWAEQYARMSQRLDVYEEGVDESCLNWVSRRQAWQFQVAPYRRDDDVLLMMTSERFLPRAMRFVSRCLPCAADVLLTEERMLGEVLEWCYPMAGMDATKLGADPLDALMGT